MDPFFNFQELGNKDGEPEQSEQNEVKRTGLWSGYNRDVPYANVAANPTNNPAPPEDPPATRPVVAFPDFGFPFEASTIAQLGNPYLGPQNDKCPVNDPVNDCFAECNQKVRQHNLNCKIALKLYTEYLKEQGCKVGGCKITAISGCKNVGNKCTSRVRVVTGGGDDVSTITQSRRRGRWATRRRATRRRR